MLESVNLNGQPHKYSQIRKTMSSSIFYSLESALNTLIQVNSFRSGCLYSRASLIYIVLKVQQHPEIQQLLNICKNDGVLKECNGRYLPVETNHKSKSESAPFIVIEGLDGTGLWV